MTKTPIISCELCGGLGNQLFQIASTVAYGLDHQFTPLFHKIKESPSVFKNRNVYWDSVLHQVPTTHDELSHLPHFQEQGFSYKKIPTFSESTLLKGYFQSPQYFETHKEHLLNLFSLPEPMQTNIESNYKELLALPHKTAIHIRRGDYLKLKHFHFSLSESNYYEKALAKLPNAKELIVFSDDINWCKKHIKRITTPWKKRFFKSQIDTFHQNRQWTFVQDNDITELYLMSQCDQHIIANSSFSWWAAYLANHQNTVIAPKKWFGKKGPKDLQDLFPAHWTSI